MIGLSSTAFKKLFTSAGILSKSRLATASFLISSPFVAAASIAATEPGKVWRKVIDFVLQLADAPKVIAEGVGLDQIPQLV